MTQDRSWRTLSLEPKPGEQMRLCKNKSMGVEGGKWASEMNPTVRTAPWQSSWSLVLLPSLFSYIKKDVAFLKLPPSSHGKQGFLSKLLPLLLIGF